VGKSFWTPHAFVKYCIKNHSKVFNPSAVGYTLQKYRQTNSLEDKPRSGRPRVSSARNDRILIRMCRQNCRMTSQELQQQWSNQTGVQCSTRTVRGQLLDHGLRSYKAIKRPLINERQRLARRLWAQAHKNSQELEEDFVVRRICQEFSFVSLSYKQ
uniref:Transposase Tc1-like domain-containing protein n=1 Tax=Myripristis murdjan TaxID=586833 RepID=A0A668ANT3_9TELE